MSEPVNLNRFRKTKAKAGKEAKAAENRARFGRTKADKALDAARADRLQRDLDGAKRED